jgi:predicted membrane-bound spermidine synthase
MSHNLDKPLSNLVKGGFFTIFFSTGFSALIFQIIWQRVLTVHAGVDLYSVTTVVAAFMAGLGLGSLLGGYIADRLSIRHCFVLFIVSNCAIGIFGFFSLWLFYDFYSYLALYLKSTISSFLFHFVLLCIPTTFMGLSLPLLSKALVRTSDEMSSLVGALYGINTLGAAVGAGLGTWYMLGTLGFIVSIKTASSINIVCSLLAIILLSRLKFEASVPLESDPIPKHTLDLKNNVEEEWILFKKPTVWILIYGLTGFAALSLEIVWFRLLSVINKSNSYVFGHLLFIFLCGVGFGSLISSRLINRVKRPDRLFLWMQYSIGLLSLLGPMLLIFSPKSMRMAKLLNIYPPEIFNLKLFVKYLISFNFFAIFIFGLATVFMGMCFPLIQRIVSRQMKSLGRNLSKLLFSNIVGNILGSIVAGFILLDLLGTPATLKIISVLLVIPGIAAAYSLKNKAPRFLSIVAVSITSLLLIVIFPKEEKFWTFFHAIDAEQLLVKEDRTSLTSLAKNNKMSYGSFPFEIFINGKSQSWIPYGGNHSVLGMAPGLYHPNPKKGLVIGFGSGDTVYSMAVDRRLDKAKCIELSGGQMKLLKKESWRKPLWQVKKMFNDPRIQIKTGDGRKFLLHSEEKFDVIEIDAFHPFTSYSGNLYSVEFFNLIKQHLNPGGVFCQWIASSRVEKTVLSVFPHVIRFGKLFILASEEPIEFNRSEILERLNNLNLLESHGLEEVKYITDYFTKTQPVTIQAGNSSEFMDDDINYDLFPKDEYFINNRVDKKNLVKSIM